MGLFRDPTTSWGCFAQNAEALGYLRLTGSPKRTRIVGFLNLGNKTTLAGMCIAPRQRKKKVYSFFETIHS